MTYHRNNSPTTYSKYKYANPTTNTYSRNIKTSGNEPFLNRQNVSVFYTIPRTNVHFSTDTLFSITTDTENNPQISTSLYKYLHEIKEKIHLKKIDIEYNLFSYLHKTFYIHKVTGGPYSLCNQVACQTHMYNELLSSSSPSPSPSQHSTNIHILKNKSEPMRQPPPPPHIIHPFVHNIDIAFFEYIELAHIIHMHNDNQYQKNFLYMGLQHNNSLKQFQYAITFLRNKHSRNDQHETTIIDPNWVNSSEIPTNLFAPSSTKNFEHVVIDGRSSASNEYDIAMNTLFLVMLVLSQPVQNTSSSMIICLDDCFTAITLDLLYLITFFYERTFFIKPIVCNLSSGTRYLVCKGFRPYHEHNILQTRLSELYSKIHSHVCTQPNNPIQRFLRQSIPYMFYSKIEEINSILNQPRLEFMHQRINYHESEVEKRFRSKSSTTKSNDHDRKTTIYEIKKCIEWCNRFQIPVENNILQLFSASSSSSLSSHIKHTV